MNCPYCNKPTQDEVFSVTICQHCSGAPLFIEWNTSDYPTHSHAPTIVAYFRVIFYLTLNQTLYRIEYFPNDDKIKLLYAELTPEETKTSNRQFHLNILYSLQMKELCQVQSSSLHPNDLESLILRYLNLKAFI